MDTRTRTRILAGLIALGLAGAAQAAAGDEHAADSEMQPVDGIWIAQRLDGWRPIDRDTLIIWATPFRPYLVKLARPSNSLPFAQAIGVTSTAGTVYAKFDSVIVDGFRYPISAIYSIDRDAAREMKSPA